MSKESKNWMPFAQVAELLIGIEKIKRAQLLNEFASFRDFQDQRSLTIKIEIMKEFCRLHPEIFYAPK